MSEDKKVVEKAKKLADPIASAIDKASQEMIARAHELGIETVFDRAENMKACNIGNQGTCCKNCAMGPCRLPLSKSVTEGEEDDRKGLCGATANTIAARNFLRMIAAGCAAHSDHGRTVAEVFLAAAKKETDAYRVKDTNKLLEIAPHWDVATQVEVDGEMKDRNIDEIAVEVAEKALAEWGKTGSEITYAKRAPQPVYDRWKKLGVIPRNIDREIVDIMHRTHMGVDQDYKNLMKQGARAALADGWAGAMIATDLQDVLFGTPHPVLSEANLGVLKEDHVNIIIHGHEPVLSDMIVAIAQTQEMIDYAKAQGAKGIQLSGICCTAMEILSRHGVPTAGTYLQQELAIITGACDAMVVDVQCVFQALANVSKCFHTKLITTHKMGKMEQDNVLHIEFDEHHAIEDAKRIIKIACDNYKNRGEVRIPKHKNAQIAGFSVEAIKYHLGGTFRGTFYTLNDNIINGRIRGVAGVVGCSNARTRLNETHITLVKELIKNDVLVLSTGCNGIACAMEGLLQPESAAVFCGSGLKEICETVGIPPVLHMGSCVDNSRILLAATEVVNAGGLGKDLADLPVAGSAPEWMSEKAIAIGQYFVSSGVYVLFGGVGLPIDGAPVFKKHLFEDMEKMYGGRWDVEPDPYKQAQKIIEHMDKKRKALGLKEVGSFKAQERVLMDMADRQKLEA